jgi:hypothetical protein
MGLVMVAMLAACRAPQLSASPTPEPAAAAAHVRPAWSELAAPEEEEQPPQQQAAERSPPPRPCEDTATCEPVSERPPLAPVQGANISLGEVSADGQRIAELQCAVARPMLGGLAVVAELAQSKAAFDRCAPKGDAAIVEWTTKSGRINSAFAHGANTDTIDDCIEKALRKTSMGVDCRCAGVLLFGQTSGADKGLERLRANAG